MIVCTSIWGFFTFIYPRESHQEREEKKTAAALAIYEQYQENAAQREEDFWNKAGPGAKEAFDFLEKARNALRSVVHVDPGQAMQLVQEQPEILIVDLRTPEEFAEGHIPGAVNRDFGVEDFKKSLEDLDKSKPWLIHGASGERSSSALKPAVEVGAFDLYHLDGGFNAWKEAKLRVE